MGRTAVVMMVALSGAALAGCGGSSGSLGGVTTAPAVTISSAGASAYLGGLRAAESSLARAEQAIPAHPSNPAALARSIRLLASAIGRLAAGLEVLRPPAIVAGAHARLIAVVRAYEGRLEAAARTASRPGQEAATGAALLSATNAASSRFSTVVGQINGVLK
jgi:hypothetical protein